MKNEAKAYLHFTRSERRGIFLLLSLIVVSYASTYLYAYFLPEKQYDTSEFEEDIVRWQAAMLDQDSIRKKEYADKRKSKYESWSRKDGGDRSQSKKDYPGKRKYEQQGKPAVSIQGFPFDPNAITKSEWLRLGLPEKTVNTILNYRKKGGRFHKKEDLKKIYGLKTEWYDALAPFIDIPKREERPRSHPQKNEPIAANVPEPHDAETPVSTPRKKPGNNDEKIVMDVNTSSEEALQKVYGIGPYYAKQIVNYRKKLGGYVRLEQVAEIYVLPDSVYQKIKPGLKLGSPSVQKININTATAEELKAHPYIKWKVARAIVKYREAHGGYRSVEDLTKNYAVNAELLDQLKPYLSVE